MKKIMQLFRLQLDNKFNLFKRSSPKDFAKAVLGYVAPMCLITLALWFLFKQIFFFVGIIVNAELISIVLLAFQGISFVFAVSSIISTLYMSRDNELLIVLPVTFNQLFISKIMVLYVMELLFSLLYVLPVLLTLGILGALPLTYYVMIFVLFPILPILPLAVASLVSIPAVFVVRFFMRRPLLSVVSVLLLVAGAFVGYMAIISQISGAFNIADKQLETNVQIGIRIKEIGASIPVFYALAKSLLSFSLIYYPVLYLVGAGLFFCGCFLLIRPFYFKVATMATENSTAKSKVKPFKKRKPFAELLLSEIRQVFRSSGYVFQYFLFPLFMPLIVYTYDKLLISIAVNQAGQNMILGSHMLVLCIVSLMSNTISSTAISRSGVNFYLAKTTPVNVYTQVLAKLAFNTIFTVGAIIITTISTLLFVDLSPLSVIMCSVIAIVFSVGHICHSFDMDLCHPVLDWYDHSEISTIGKSTTKCVIYALVLSVLACVLVLLGAGKGGAFLSFVPALVVAVFYALGRCHLLYVRIEHYYDHMEV